jgi:predicted DNA-binding transcriptional regulator
MIKELEHIGMGKNEAAVYEALVQHGPCKAGLLVVKLDIHRNLIYQSLDKLVLKGFATKVMVKGVATFQITDPHSLLSSFRQQESILSVLVEQIQARKASDARQIVVYEGIESYRSYWVSSLERVPVGTVDYVLGGTTQLDEWEKMMGDSYKKYDELRKKKKIVWKTVHFSVTDSERRMLRTHPELTEYRLFERGADHVGNVNIIHDTIILHTWVGTPRIIEIRDPLLVTMFQNYFDIIWSVSKPIE